MRPTCPPRTPSRRPMPRSVVLVASCLPLLAACSETRPTEARTALVRADGARIELLAEVDPNALMLTDPHAAVLRVGEGVALRARVLDADGVPLPDARPVWQSHAPEVAAAEALPDSALAPGARVRVAARRGGRALVVARLGALAETTVVTVRASVDSATPRPPHGDSATPPPPRDSSRPPRP